jgi:hypothetical protein
VPAPRVCCLCATTSSGFVTLQYVERTSDPIGATGEASHQPSRIQEGALIRFVESLPANAIGVAKLERENGTWHILDDFHAPRVPVVQAR